jgi:hypothetical protein
MGAVMSAAHTPGPWQVSGVRYKWRDAHSDRLLDSHQVGPDGNGIALVPYDPNSHREAMADARLIAAAPDLLAVVRGLLAWEDQDDIALDPVMEAARAAIAKATGGQQ